MGFYSGFELLISPERVKTLGSLLSSRKNASVAAAATPLWRNYHAAPPPPPPPTVQHVSVLICAARVHAFTRLNLHESAG